MTQQRPARIGIIGTGSMGKVHADSYRAHSNASIAMIASRSEDNARHTAEKLGAAGWTTDWKALIHSEDVDAVDITAPNHLHREMALEAALAGKPFLIEKPLATTLADADAIIDRAENKGVTGVYGENMRFAPAAVQARSIIEQGGIGDVILLRTTEVNAGPFHSDWFWDAEKAGGGTVIDNGVHGLYLLEWMAGARVKRVYAELDILKWKQHCKSGTEDSAFVTLRFENGAIAELLNSWAVAGGRDVRTEIYGTTGTIHIDQARQEAGMLVYSQEGYGAAADPAARQRTQGLPTQGWHFPIPDAWRMHGHAYLIEHFLDVVLNGSKPICTLREGRRVLQLVEAIYESGRSGRAVELASGA